MGVGFIGAVEGGENFYLAIVRRLRNGWRIDDIDVLDVDLAAGGNDDVGRRVVPLALCIQVGAHFDGSKDRVSIGNDFSGGFQDGFRGKTDIHAAPLHQAGGGSVAVNPAIVNELVVLGDVVGMAPVEEIGLDAEAIVVFANDAFSLVALEGGEFALGENRGCGSPLRGAPDRAPG